MPQKLHFIKGLDSEVKDEIINRLIKEGVKRVSKESLLYMMNNNIRMNNDDDLVTKILEKLIVNELMYEFQYDILLDSSLLRPEHKEYYKAYCEEMGFEFIFVDLTGIPLIDVIKYNNKYNIYHLINIAKKYIPDSFNEFYNMFSNDDEFKFFLKNHDRYN